jgi:hypothetical protein
MTAACRTITARRRGQHRCRASAATAVFSRCAIHRPNVRTHVQWEVPRLPVVISSQEDVDDQHQSSPLSSPPSSSLMASGIVSTIAAPTDIDKQSTIPQLHAGAGGVNVAPPQICSPGAEVGSPIAGVFEADHGDRQARQANPTGKSDLSPDHGGLRNWLLLVFMWLSLLSAAGSIMCFQVPWAGHSAPLRSVRSGDSSACKRNVAYQVGLYLGYAKYDLISTYLYGGGSNCKGKDCTEKRAGLLCQLCNDGSLRRFNDIDLCTPDPCRMSVLHVFSDSSGELDQLVNATLNITSSTWATRSASELPKGACLAASSLTAILLGAIFVFSLVSLLSSLAVFVNAGLPLPTHIAETLQKLVASWPAASLIFGGAWLAAFVAWSPCQTAIPATFVIHGALGPGAWIAIGLVLGFVTGAVLGASRSLVPGSAAHGSGSRVLLRLLRTTAVAGLVTLPFSVAFVSFQSTKEATFFLTSTSPYPIVMFAASLITIVATAALLVSACRMRYLVAVCRTQPAVPRVQSDECEVDCFWPWNAWFFGAPPVS